MNEYFRENFEFNKEAVKNNGLSIKYIDFNFKNNFELS